MSEEHTNVKLLRQLNPADMAASGELFATDVVTMAEEFQNNTCHPTS